jgi:hypothetical protein
MFKAKDRGSILSSVTHQFHPDLESRLQGGIFHPKHCSEGGLIQKGFQAFIAIFPYLQRFDENVVVVANMLGSDFYPQ